MTTLSAGALYDFCVGRPKNAKVAFARSIPVGIVTTIIDFGLLIYLTEFLGVHYLLSAVAGFVLSQVWAYVAHAFWVFGRFDSHAKGLSIFLVISAAGLLVTEVSLWFATEQLGLYYVLSKVVVSALASLAMFFIRKRIVFS